VVAAEAPARDASTRTVVLLIPVIREIWQSLQPLATSRSNVIDLVVQVQTTTRLA
jgi:hypothetical protein